VEHKCHHDPEQLPVVQKKIEINEGKFEDEFGCRFVVLKEMIGFFIELFDIAEENMRVDFFLAFEIQINGTFAEF
jgi:hypothetical protein